MNPKRLLQGVVVVGAILLVLHDPTPEKALELFIILMEVARK